MLNKGNVIELALLKLGKNQEYNDNKSDEYIVANKLLDNVVEFLAKDTTLLFNATTIKLTKYSSYKNEFDEYIYNKPADMLNIIKIQTDAREDGEYILSKDKEVIITYCRKVDIINLPNYINDLLVYSLCVEMCLAFSSYTDRQEYFIAKQFEEKQKLISNQINNLGGIYGY